MVREPETGGESRNRRHLSPGILKPHCIPVYWEKRGKKKKNAEKVKGARRGRKGRGGVDEGGDEKQLSSRRSVRKVRGRETSGARKASIQVASELAHRKSSLLNRSLSEEEASRNAERHDDAATSAPAPNAGRWRGPWLPGAAGPLREPSCGGWSSGHGTRGRAEDIGRRG
jgi:hypothetical protein